MESFEIRGAKKWVQVNWGGSSDSDTASIKSISKTHGGETKGGGGKEARQHRKTVNSLKKIEYLERFFC